MIIEHDGIAQPVEEWALDYGITPDLITSRLAAGWNAAKALETPMAFLPGYRLPAIAAAEKRKRTIRKRDRIAFGGQELTVAEWARVTGLSYQTIAYRLRNDWPIERALSEMPRIGGDQRSKTDRGYQATSPDRLGTGGGSSAQDSV